MTDHVSGDLEYVADIVTAYLSNNPVAASAIPELIMTVHDALAAARAAALQHSAPDRKPAVPVKRSITPEAIICLEDGRRFKSLKRHLATQYGLTPAQYRARWALPSDYPMVAPNYAASRAEMAKASGLGQSRRKRQEPGPEPQTSSGVGQASDDPQSAQPNGPTDPG
ncbi:Ros/MucR family transcriptional regulator [Alsobacter sp. SYSU BS001988]